MRDTQRRLQHPCVHQLNLRVVRQRSPRDVARRDRPLEALLLV